MDTPWPGVGPCNEGPSVQHVKQRHYDVVAGSVRRTGSHMHIYTSSVGGSGANGITQDEGPPDPDYHDEPRIRHDGEPR